MVGGKFGTIENLDVFELFSHQSRGDITFEADTYDSAIFDANETIRNVLKSGRNNQVQQDKPRPFSENEVLKNYCDDELSNGSRQSSAKNVSVNELPWRAFLMRDAADRESSYKSLDFFGKLHEEICALVAWLRPQEHECRARDSVIESVRGLAKSLWSRSTVTVFGSYVSNLCLPNGDIDLCIFNAPHSDRAKKQLALQLHRTKMGKSVKIIDAKVPLVKFIDRKTGIPVDVCFSQQSSLDTSQFVVDKLREYPWLRPLVLILKLFLVQRGLSETYKGGLGSYLLFAMVLSMLQHSNVATAPPTAFHTNLGHLILRFFELYGADFNYSSCVISVRGKGDYLPKRGRWLCEQRRFLLSVESPLDPTSDLGKNSYAIRKIQRAFQFTYQKLRYLSKLHDQHGGELPKGSSSILETIINVEDPLFSNRVLRFSASSSPKDSTTSDPSDKTKRRIYTDSNGNPYPNIAAVNARYESQQHVAHGYNRASSRQQQQTSYHQQQQQTDRFVRKTNPKKRFEIVN